MNEWINEWMNEWMNEGRNEGMKELMNVEATKYNFINEYISLMKVCYLYTYDDKNLFFFEFLT